MSIDLDRLFDGRRSALSAQEAFTDRVSEADAFDAALEAQRRAVTEYPGMTVDMTHPRRNVLVYYGMGGIGKSTLSRELYRRFVESRPTEAQVAFRVDFADKAAFDLEATLLELRASFGRARGGWHAFDLALATYWERKHPGRPLVSFIETSGRLKRIVGSQALQQQVQDALDALVGGGVGAVGSLWRAGDYVASKIVERVRERRVLKDCPLFAPLILEEDPDKVRPYLPALLAWDLSRHQEKGALDVCVFFDTWEDVQAQPPAREGAEDILARLVFLMPNVLFVVTGRNRLTWADGRQSPFLMYAGDERWPGLIDPVGEPRQHLLGALSSEDCERYLCGRLVAGGGPAIPAQIRHRIIEGSGGLPLYLDLSADMYDSLSSRREEVPEDEFGHPLPEIVLRVMRDLDAPERDLLRIAALVGHFNEELLASAAPDIRAAFRARFLSRHFVRAEARDWLPYSLHESLRAAVRACDATTRDAWRPREWRQAANLALQYFGRELDSLIPSADLSDRPDLSVLDGRRSTLIQGFLEACSLADEAEEIPDWLISAAGCLFHAGQFEALAWWAGRTGADDSAVHVLSVGLLGLAERDRVPLKTTEDRLRSAAHDRRLPLVAQDFHGRWLAQNLDWQGRAAEAQIELERIVTRGGPMTIAARVELGYLSVWHGRYRSALAAVADLSDPAWDYWRYEIEAECLHANGDIGNAEDASRRSLEAARRRRSAIDTAAALRQLARLIAWRRPDDTETLIAEALDANQAIGSRIGLGQTLATQALAAIGRDAPDNVLTYLAESRRLLEAAGHRGELAHPGIVEVFLWCARGDWERAAAARSSLESIIRPLHHFPHWSLVSAAWLSTGGLDPGDHIADLEWLDPIAEIEQRWRGILAVRHAQTLDA